MVERENPEILKVKAGIFSLANSERSLRLTRDPNDIVLADLIAERRAAKGDFLLDGQDETDVDPLSLDPFELLLYSELKKGKFFNLNFARKAQRILSQYPDDLPAASLRFYGQIAMPNWMEFFDETPDSWKNFMAGLEMHAKTWVSYSVGDAARMVANHKKIPSHLDEWYNCTMEDMRGIKEYMPEDHFGIRDAFIVVAFGRPDVVPEAA